MNVTPISTDVIHFPKEKLAHLDVIAGFDRGCTLIKMVYLPKKSEEASADEGDTYTLHAAVFLNEDMEAALDFMKEKAELPKGGKLHITGVGGMMFENLISEKLGMTPVFVDEIMSQCRGIYFLISNIPIENITYIDDSEANKHEDIKHSELMKKMMQEAQDTFKEANTVGPFPALVSLMGSGAGIVRINADGCFSIVESVAMGGKCLLGLSNLLLGTSKYDEMVSLANAGDRANVDTQVKEMLDDNENSPYGRYPPDLPIFSFGKASEHHNADREYSREDIAASLVGLQSMSMVTSTLFHAGLQKLAKVYVAGNMFKGRQFRHEILSALKMYFAESFLQLHFLKIGHTGAIGAMISNPGDELKYAR